MNLKQAIVFVQSNIREYLVIIIASLLMAMACFILGDLGGSSGNLLEVFGTSSNLKKPRCSRRFNGDDLDRGKMQELINDETSTYLSDIFVPYGYDFGSCWLRLGGCIFSSTVGMADWIYRFDSMCAGHSSECPRLRLFLRDR